MRIVRHWLVLLSLGTLTSSPTVQAAELRFFSPLGEAKQVRQVRAVFDVPVRALGDPAGPPPLRSHCVGSDKPLPSTGRWVDTQTWVMEFGKELPAGLKCEFTPVENYRDVTGKPVIMQSAYRFNTGGPNLTSLTAVGGAYTVDEEALFVAQTTGAIDPRSIESSVYCKAEGIGERIPVRMASAAERTSLLKDAGFARDADTRHVAYFRCARKLPAGAKVAVVWGIGVRSVSGLPTTQEEKAEFRVRPEFSVTLSCERENAKADCTPFGNISLRFTAPVKREDILKVKLVSASGRTWAAEVASDEEESDDVEYVSFRSPFPPREEFHLQVPAQIRDDAGRPLRNRNRLAAVSIKTTDYPPLLKFAADFGIVELNAGGLLPLTVRNLEALLPADSGLAVADGSAAQTSAKVRLLRLKTDEQIIAWLRNEHPSQKNTYERDISVLRQHSDARVMLLPKPNGPKPMEVVGIPLGAPGFYAVEGESQLLGKRLLASQKPMYVRTDALNTNLAVHYKKGDENSLVWVTALDTGLPVADARITVRDCKGKQLSFGKTSADGTMLIPRRLELDERQCGTAYVFARTTIRGVEDMSMVATHWQKGIERWRFQLPYAGILPDIVTHTVFDRPLFRSGETVSMQHIARRHTTSGFAFVPADQLPDRILISLEGGGDSYEMPISWKGGVADTVWKIPEAAKLGKYWVSFLRPGEKGSSMMGEEYEDSEGWSPTTRLWRGGSFRIADFRLPALKAEVITGGGKPLVADAPVMADLRLSYLAGGGAAGEKVRLRSEMRPTWLQGKDALEEFIIGSAPVEAKQLADQGWTQPEQKAVVFDDQRDVVLDREGTRHLPLGALPQWQQPAEVFTEVEYTDPSGEVRTAGTLRHWFPGARVAGIRAASLQSDSSDARLNVATLTTDLKPAARHPYSVEAWYRRAFVHRKRMLGGYYTWDTRYTLTPLGQVCQGTSDAKGMAECRFKRPPREAGQSSAELIVEARVRDSDGRMGYASTTIWQGDYESEDYWFSQDESERIDILPERKQYAPGETAQLQVRMPFREATALVSVEREGILDRFTVPLSGKDPRISVPIKPNYGPNVFISVLVVRGRVGEVQPTALVDLGKPAYKLGVAEINVGWQGYTLKVAVEPDKTEFKAREEITAKVRVTHADGTPAKGGEFALAVVDEALLELAKNNSWALLERMLGRRGYSVETATAQSQVIGKRHFGLKAVPAGGGGGRQPTREVFDTLLAWQAHVTLDDNGEARIRVPLNDSLTAFRIVAIARQGAGRFGTGSAVVRSTRDLQLFAGLPPVVREGDRFRAMVTVRNLGKAAETIQVTPVATAAGAALPGIGMQTVSLAAGESRELGWPVTVPGNIRRIDWRIDASTAGGAQDALKFAQGVTEALPAKVTAATLEQLDGKRQIPVQRPADAVAGSGSVDVFLKPTLGLSTDSVRDYMARYPYNCLEQQVSRAIATANPGAWQQLMDRLPTYFYHDGLAGYFPPDSLARERYSGSPVLTAYLLAVAHEAGYAIPEESRDRMLNALAGFVEGRVAQDKGIVPYWSPRPDLPQRRLAAIEALSRYGRATPGHIATVQITPGLWPTSSLIDWLSILQRMPKLPARAKQMQEVENQLRTRMDAQGTMMRFNTEQTDFWWWMMASPDSNAVRGIAALIDQPGWARELPRLVRGVLARQQGGHWGTTTANAWGVLMLEKFARKFEAQPVTGQTQLQLDGSSPAALTADWATMNAERMKREAAQAEDIKNGRVARPGANTGWQDNGDLFRFTWPASGKGSLALSHQGSGKPWVTVQTRAARPLKAPVNAGFGVQKTITAIERKQAGRWSRGDIARIRIEVDAPSQWTWVVVDDPVPAGATILGGGLAGQDSAASAAVANSDGDWWGRASFIERSFSSYRAYYEYFPRGKKVIEYAIRINNPGDFSLPPTRVEAMYAPENYGEFPNPAWRVE